MRVKMILLPLFDFETDEMICKKYAKSQRFGHLTYEKNN